MPRLSRIFLVTLLLLPPLPLLADSTSPTYDRVTLSESASIEVQNDQMVAVLFSQHEGRNASRLAQQVNRDITEAIGMVRKVPGIEVSTQSYRTQPIYRKNEIAGWRVFQSIRLKSTDSRALGDLLASLQERLKLQSIRYQVSPAQRRRHIDAITRTALERFSRRAGMIATALGRPHWRLVRLSVNDGGNRPVTMMRAGMVADMAMDKRTPVAVEAGTARLEVSVNGEIELTD